MRCRKRGSRVRPATKKSPLLRRRDNPLRVLEVIKRMEVGPVRVEKNRLVAPYRLIQDNKSDIFSLIYRFEEDVFEPGEYASLNLAGMLAAQVAMNYGLFCKEIIFHGPYDKTDRAFIKDMMENTAREIYVKKFQEHNPFLQGKAAHLPLLKCKSYVRAKILFDHGKKLSPSEAKKLKEESRWPVSGSRHAVLTSGGKDSLLSFSLLKEIVNDVHSVFINESGRHWYTALNGYRYLSSKYPETARVWTNSDRLFAWMLRHFPFIRKDFAQVRSDEYPVRLWTVAVFLFGALPILRKRGIGRLIIGDEFDTTTRVSFHGVPHYNGLFDQSRYFDNVLTRYYQRKNWGIKQFSIIRPLSELLIEKILVERYPDVQRNQVSCHATHIEGDRVFPCGQCEKCRRIVGMLMAIGANPANCGYTQQQIEFCLESLAERGVHQEVEGSQQMSFLLKQKGLIQETSKDFRPVEQPQVLKVRFDPVKSPFDVVPADLRRPLLRLFLDHAQGAVRRQGRAWVDCNPLT